ncbi:hypothetical protein GCM10009756_03430 [Pseudokineococcus marinus]
MTLDTTHDRGDEPPGPRRRKYTSSRPLQRLACWRDVWPWRALPRALRRRLRAQATAGGGGGKRRLTAATGGARAPHEGSEQLDPRARPPGRPRARLPDDHYANPSHGALTVK